MKYEYTTLVVPQGKSLNDELNSFGSQGWKRVDLIYRGLEDVDWIVIFEKATE